MEAPEKVPVDPFASGIQYHTVSINGKFFHINNAHVLMVDLQTGGVAHFTWDDITSALAAKLVEKEKEEELRKKVAGQLIAQQQAKPVEKPVEAPAAKPEGYRKKADPKSKLSKRAQSFKKG